MAKNKSEGNGGRLKLFLGNIRKRSIGAPMTSQLRKKASKKKPFSTCKAASICKCRVLARQVPKPIIIKDDPSNPRITKGTKSNTANMRTPSLIHQDYNKIGQEDLQRRSPSRTSNVYGPPELSLGPPSDFFGWWNNTTKRRQSVAGNSGENSCQKSGGSSSAAKEQTPSNKSPSPNGQTSSSPQNKNGAGSNDQRRRDDCLGGENSSKKPTNTPDNANSQKTLPPESPEKVESSSATPRLQSKDKSKSKEGVRKRKGTHEKESYTNSEFKDIIFIVEALFDVSKKMGKKNKAGKNHEFSQKSSHHQRSLKSAGKPQASTSKQHRAGNGHDPAIGTCNVDDELADAFVSLREFASKCVSEGSCSSDDDDDDDDEDGHKKGYSLSKRAKNGTFSFFQRSLNSAGEPQASTSKQYPAGSGHDRDNGSCNVDDELADAFESLREFASKCESEGFCNDDDDDDNEGGHKEGAYGQHGSENSANCSDVNEEHGEDETDVKVFKRTKNGKPSLQHGSNARATQKRQCNEEGSSVASAKPGVYKYAGTGSHHPKKDPLERASTSNIRPSDC